MPKYTEEELFNLRESAVAPAGVDFKEFSDMVAEVGERLKKLSAERGEHNGSFQFRRRSSRLENKPHFKKGFHQYKQKHEAAIVQDEDGWVTLKGNAKKSFGAGNEEARDEFRKVKPEIVKVKPNTKNIGSRGAADSREAAAEKSSKTFNAFSALESESESEEESEEDSEEESEEE